MLDTLSISAYVIVHGGGVFNYVHKISMSGNWDVAAGHTVESSNVTRPERNVEKLYFTGRESYLSFTQTQFVVHVRDKRVEIGLTKLSLDTFCNTHGSPGVLFKQTGRVGSLASFPRFTITVRRRGQHRFLINELERRGHRVVDPCYRYKLGVD